MQNDIESRQTKSANRWEKRSDIVDRSSTTNRHRINEEESKQRRRQGELGIQFQCCYFDKESEVIAENALRDCEGKRERGQWEREAIGEEEAMRRPFDLDLSTDLLLLSPALSLSSLLPPSAAHDDDSNTKVSQAPRPHARAWWSRRLRLCSSGACRCRRCCSDRLLLLSPPPCRRSSSCSSSSRPRVPGSRNRVRAAESRAHPEEHGDSERAARPGGGGERCEGGNGGGGDFLLQKEAAAPPHPRSSPARRSRRLQAHEGLGEGARARARGCYHRRSGSVGREEGRRRRGGSRSGDSGSGGKRRGDANSSSSFEARPDDDRGVLAAEGRKPLQRPVGLRRELQRVRERGKTNLVSCSPKKQEPDLENKAKLRNSKNVLTNS